MGRRLRRYVRPAGAAAAVLVLDIAASALLFHRIAVHLATWTLDSGHSDPSLFVWWLAWAPFSIGHGIDPIYTHYWNAPSGIDALWNTSVLAIGVLMAPVTALLGPLVAYNLASILGPALSAATATWWLRRYMTRPAAIVGGLVFGFSPFEVQQANGHLHLTWLALVPVMVMLAEDVIWRAPRPWRRAGPLLGLAVVAEWFISSEVVVIAAIGMALTLVVVMVQRRRGIIERLKPALLGLATSLIVAAALLAGPLVEMFSSSNVIKGPLQPLNRWQSHFSYLIDAPATLRFHNAAGAAAANRTVSYENGMYIGLPLLVLLAAAAVWLWRRPGVLPAVLGAVGMFVLSLGGAGPWRLVENRVGMLQNVLPLRFGLFMWLEIAFVVAAVVDALTGQAAPARGWPSRGWPALRWPALALVGLCLLPLLPDGIVRVGPTPHVPPFFTTSEVDVIPQGANVLLVPMPRNEDNAGLLWQAASGMRFAQPATMAFRPGDHHEPVFAPVDTDLLRWFSPYTAFSWFVGPVTPAISSVIHADLAASRISVVVLGTDPPLPGEYGVVEGVFGRPPDLVEGGVDLWWVTGRPGHSLR